MADKEKKTSSPSSPKKQQKSFKLQQNIFKTQNIAQNLNKQSASLHSPQNSTSKQRKNDNLFQESKNSQRKTNLENTNSNQKFNDSCGQIKSQRSISNSAHFNQDSKQILTEEQINSKLIINGYFQQIFKPIENKKSNVKKYSDQIEVNLQNNINNGMLRIQKHKEDIQNLLQQFKMSQQQIKILEKKALVDLKNQKIKLLDPYRLQKSEKQRKNGQHDASVQKIQLNNFIQGSILSKQQHKRIIKKFILSNKKNEEHHKAKLFKQQQREKSLSLQKKAQQEASIKRFKQQRKLSIQKKLLKKKQIHQQFLQQQKQSNQRYQLMKNQKFLYKQMQEKYNSEASATALQVRKVKLKQIRDFHKKYDIQELKKHEQQYLEKKSQSSSKHNSRHKINSFHYNPPQRAKRLTELLQQEKYQAKVKFEQKRRIIEENKLKQINFISDIKIKYRPKVDIKKRQEIQLRFKSQQSELARKLVERDLKQIGMRHFQESKKAMKKKSPKQRTEGNQYSRQDCINEFNSVKLLTKIDLKLSTKKYRSSISSSTNHNASVSQAKRRQIRKIIESQQIQRQDKLKKLKIQNQRINQIYKRKQKYFNLHQDNQKTREQAISLLLNSIQTKIGIIDVCTKE